MPVARMDSPQPGDKNKKKNIEELSKKNKSILDFFKTPEKEISTKQKNLLHFFSKTTSSETKVITNDISVDGNDTVITCDEKTGAIPKKKALNFHKNEHSQLKEGLPKLKSKHLKKKKKKEKSEENCNSSFESLNSNHLNLDDDEQDNSPEKMLNESDSVILLSNTDPNIETDLKHVSSRNNYDRKIIAKRNVTADTEETCSASDEPSINKGSVDEGNCETINNVRKRKKHKHKKNENALTNETADTSVVSDDELLQEPNNATVKGHACASNNDTSHVQFSDTSSLDLSVIDGSECQDKDDTDSDKSGSSTASRKEPLKCQQMMDLLKEVQTSEKNEKKKRSKHKHKHKHSRKDKECDDTVVEDVTITNEAGVCEGEHNELLTSSNIVTVEKETTGQNVYALAHAQGNKDETCTNNDGNSDDVNENDKLTIESGKYTEAVIGEDETRENIRKHHRKKSKLKKHRKESENQHTSNNPNTHTLENTERKGEIDENDHKSISYEEFLKNLESRSNTSNCNENENGKLSTGAEIDIKDNHDNKESNLIDKCNESMKSENGCQVDKNMEVDNVCKNDPDSEISTTDGEMIVSKCRKSRKLKKKQLETMEDVEVQDSAAEDNEHIPDQGIKRFFAIMTSTPDKGKNIQAASEVDPKKMAVCKNKSPLKLQKENGIVKKSKSQKVDKINARKKDQIIEIEHKEIINVSHDSDKTDNVVAVINDDDKTEVDKLSVTKGNKTKYKNKEECTNQKTFKSVEDQKKKDVFLKSSNTHSVPTKTSQATLSFAKSGLLMNKHNSSKDTDSECKLDRPIGRPKKKGKTEESGVNDSVFQTPKAKPAKKRRVKNNVDEGKCSEEEMTVDGTDTSEEMEGTGSEECRRSPRKKYKVAVFQLDEDNKTPIRIKLRRCPKSSSGEDAELSLSKSQKKKLTMRQTKAQALLIKAKKGKHKHKSKRANDVDNIEEAVIVKPDKKTKKRKKKLEQEMKSDNSDSDKGEMRRSSRLSGRSMASMQELSIEEIVILSEDEEELATPAKKRGRLKGAKKLKEDTPKKNTPKKAKSPVKKTGVKLAPIFMGKEPKVVERPPMDPELAKQRMQFLMSGVPSELRKQTAKTVAATVACDYPPIPRINHTQQIPEVRLGSPGIDVWRLKSVALNLRRFLVPSMLLTVSQFTGSLMDPTAGGGSVHQIEKLSKQPAMASEMFDQCVSEIAAYNTGYPTHKMCTCLQATRARVTQTDDDGKAPKADVDVEPPIVVEPKGKKGRKKSLKLQKANTDTAIVKDPKDTSLQLEAGVSVLWTEKYQPSGAGEVIGNTGAVRKLRAWLLEWQALLDREARRARKLLLKKHKGKQKLQQDADKESAWDDDSDFDLDSEDSDADDNSLCNTMLLSGPHGSGKTCAVYALAQELGFKVHEVNASSSRNGRHILSQLQEATQSHQVSHKGCGTPVKNTANKETTKSGNLMPTSFTNLFKKSTPAVATGTGTDTGKKRKRHKSEKGPCTIDDSPKRKRSKRGGSPSKSKAKVSPVDETSQSSILQGLNLSSTTMILFDEVDVVFADDKGFLSAVQTFMSTTKVPILLTTASTSFAAQFDGRYEQIIFKCPPVPTLTSHLQLICLLENVRTDRGDLVEMAAVYGCDVRRCLLALQYLVESGGGTRPTYRPISLPSAVVDPTPQPVTFPVVTDDCQASAQEDSSRGKNCDDDDDDDFVTIKPFRTKRRLVIEDDTSNSVDYSAGVPARPATPVCEELSAGDDTEGRKFPAVHRLWVEGLAAPTTRGVQCLHTAVSQCLRSHKASRTVISRLIDVCKIYPCASFSVLYNNIHTLLPLATHIVDAVARPTSPSPKKRKRRRIQTDLYDSEASNDSTDSNLLSEQTPEDKVEAIHNCESSKEKRDEGLCLVKSLSAFTRYYDTVSMLDTMQGCSGGTWDHQSRGRGTSRAPGSLQPGMDDDLPLVPTPCSVDLDPGREYRAQIDARSTCHMYAEVDNIQAQVEELARNNPAFSENFQLPVLPGTDKFTLTDRTAVSIPSVLRRAHENVRGSLPLCMYKHQRGVQLDYMPALRDMASTEQVRLASNTKRRFHHYFDSITLPLKDTTVSSLTSAFT